LVETFGDILASLPGNAVRAQTPPAEAKRLHLREDLPVRREVHRDGGEIILCVSDTGVELTSEEAEHLFERFHRSPDARPEMRAPKRRGDGPSDCEALAEQ
jgi:signal transduction histidine kinase